MSGLVLKLVAIVTMTIDHVGFVFFPNQMLWRLVGRIAFPIFALSAAEGARYTHDRKRYIIRLLIWAVASEIPFDLMGSGALWSLESQNVCWTLAAGVGCCWLAERKSTLNYALCAGLMIITTVLMTDYMFAGVIAVMIIYHYTGKGQRFRGCLLACVALSIALGPLQLFCLLALVPIHLYNGKPGKVRLKYLFYAYYPVHMLILWAVYTYTLGVLV